MREHRERHDHRRGDPCCAAPPQHPQRREQHQVEQLVEVADLVEEEATSGQQEERDDEEALAHETRSERRRRRARRGARRGSRTRRSRRASSCSRAPRRTGAAASHEEPAMETVGERRRVEGGRPEVREPEAGVRGQQHRQAEQRRPEHRAERERNVDRRDVVGRDRYGSLAVACLRRGPRTFGSLDVEALPIGDVHARMPTTRVADRPRSLGAMLWEARFWPLIADGSVTVTFRRWKRPQAVDGHRYRTPGGIIEVDRVTSVEPHAITEARRTRRRLRVACCARRRPARRRVTLR